MPEYYCSYCHYDAKGLKSNYTKHINSAKHKRMVYISTEKDVYLPVHSENQSVDHSNLCKDLENMLDNITVDHNTAIEEKDNIIADLHQKIKEKDILIQSLSDNLIRTNLEQLSISSLIPMVTIACLEAQERGIVEMFTQMLKGKVMCTKERMIFFYNNRQDQYLNYLLPQLFSKILSEAQNLVDIYGDAGYPTDLAFQTVKNIRESIEYDCNNEFSSQIVKLLAKKLS